jgi:hypothetical protein
MPSVPLLIVEKTRPSFPGVGTQESSATGVTQGIIRIVAGEPESGSERSSL